jgi:hypothetical protein
MAQQHGCALLKQRAGWETVIALADVLGVSTDAFRQAPARPADETPKRGRPRKAASVPQDEAHGEEGQPSVGQQQSATAGKPGGRTGKRKSG